MDAHEREARKLIAAGADPRRAGPEAAAHFGLAPTLSATANIIVGALIGMLGTIVMASIVLLTFGLTVATTTNLRSSSPAMQEVEAALSSIPQTEWHAALDALVKLLPLLHDAAALELNRALDRLSPTQRQVLAEDPQLPNLLGDVASLTEPQRVALQTAIEDPNSVELLGMLRMLDPMSVSVLERWGQSSDVRRRTLAAVLLIMTGPDDGRFERLVAAYLSASPSLLRLLDNRLKACDLANKEACR